MPKSPDAFRTISEVADWLGVQAHVLRFWESKFAQVKPIKRAGGRRYYRPADMLLLGGIKKLLHDDGLTIKGAQKILREQGISHVCDLSQALDDLTMAVLEGAPVEDQTAEPKHVSRQAEPEAAQAALDGEIMDDDADESDWRSSDLDAEEIDFEAAAEEEESADEELAAEYAAQGTEAEAPDEPVKAPAAAKVPERATISQVELNFSDPEEEPQTAVEEPEDSLPDFLRKPLNEVAQEAEKPEEIAQDPAPSVEAAEADAPLVEDNAAETEAAQAAQEAEAEPDMVMPAFSARPRQSSPPPEPRKPRIIDLPPLPDAADLPAFPAALSALARKPKIDAEQAHALRPLLARLIRHRASLSSPRKDVRKD